MTDTYSNSSRISSVPLQFVYVVVQRNPWFKFYFYFLGGMETYDNAFETKENKIQTKDKIEPQHTHILSAY